jgi:histidine triad (HIT) family protein
LLLLFATIEACGKTYTLFLFLGEKINMDTTCIFCKIAHNEAPATVEYKDEKITIFHDIYPKAPVHLLVIPNKHIRSLNDLSTEDNEVLAHMLQKTAEIASMKGFAKEGYKVLMNVEKGGGQVVFHLHLHVMAGEV